MHIYAKKKSIKDKMKTLRQSSERKGEVNK